jgi:hypothetical protein
MKVCRKTRIAGAHLKDRLLALAEEHPIVGAVHRSGLYLGLEFVRDRTTLEPATEETAAICDRLLRAGGHHAAHRRLPERPQDQATRVRLEGIGGLLRRLPRTGPHDWLVTSTPPLAIESVSECHPNTSCRTPLSPVAKFQPLPVELARTRGSGSSWHSSLACPNVLTLLLPQRFSASNVLCGLFRVIGVGLHHRLHLVDDHHTPIGADVRRLQIAFLGCAVRSTSSPTLH